MSIIILKLAYPKPLDYVKKQKPKKRRQSLPRKQPLKKNTKILKHFHDQIWQLHQQDNPQQALALSQQALSRFPDNGLLLKKCRRICRNVGTFSLGKRIYTALFRVKFRRCRAHNNLALPLNEKMQFDQAREHYEKVLSIKPNYVNAQYNLSFVQLGLSEFTQGWRNYEYRYHKDREKNKIIPPNTHIPQYQGEDLNGKNILIYPEQGMGDEIQFVRYLPLLKSQKKVRQIMLVCKPALKALFSTITCVDHIIDSEAFKRANIQGIHYWVFIMSLPLHFKTTLATIPNSLPYLSVSKQQQDQWNNKIPEGFNIGLVWKGSKIHKNDATRSLPSLATLKPLWALKDKLNKRIQINFINLKKGEGEAEARNSSKGQNIIHLRFPTFYLIPLPRLILSLPNLFLI